MARDNTAERLTFGWPYGQNLVGTVMGVPFACGRRTSVAEILGHVVWPLTASSVYSRTKPAPPLPGKITREAVPTWLITACTVPETGTSVIVG